MQSCICLRLKALLHLLEEFFMKKAIIMASAIVLSSLGYVSAATTPSAATKPVQSWTCQDFLDLSETYRPTAVGVVQVINEKKDTDNAFLDVDGIETITPSVVAICTANPEASLPKAVEQAKAKK